MPRIRIAVGLLAAVALAATGCAPNASTGASASANAGGGGTTVNVTVEEYSVTPESESAPAGDVTFHITNDGPNDVHEFVVVKTDLAPDALPTAEDGSFDEDGDGVEVIDEIEEIAVDESQDLTVNLESGAYVLLCNRVVQEGDETESHYAMGMHAAFTVE
jgi:uncharacterized cupredoxin-like copper-binding protein